MGALIDKPMGTFKISGGTAGTPGGAVASVQGVSGGTPVPVIPAPISAAVRGADTNVAAGTRRTFPSAAYTQGFYWVNNHATANIYIGSPSAVSSSVYDIRLLPGQRSEWFPFANPNVFGWDTDVSGATLQTIGG